MIGKTTIKVKDKGLRKFAREHPALGDIAAQTAAFEGEAYVKRSFNTSPPGNVYQYGNVTHTASKAGYPPNVDTGKLRAAIYSYRQRLGVWHVSTGDTEYAVFLEFGTQHMDPRPFMGPMGTWLQKRIDDIYRRVFRDAL